LVKRFNNGSERKLKIKTQVITSVIIILPPLYQLFKLWFDEVFSVDAYSYFYGLIPVDISGDHTIMGRFMTAG
jgi:hypothetical protein